MSGRSLSVASDRLECAALAAVVLLSVWALAWPVWRAQFLLEIDLKEPWIAYQVSALRAHALYPPVGGLISNNYPPLFYLLLDVLAGPSGDVIIVGRALSLVATICIAVCIALLVRSFGGGIAPAVLGGAWFVATLARYGDHYVGMNDPQLLGLALMMAGLVLLRCRERRLAFLGILVIVGGGFFKNSLIATPLAALGLAAMTRGRDDAVRAASVMFFTAAVGLAACALVFGPNFMPQLLFYPREMSLGHSLRSLDRLVSILPALLLWGVWVRTDRASDGARFTAFYIAVGFAAYLLQKSANLIDVNAQFELNAALGIGLGLAFDRIHLTPLVTHLGVVSVRLASLVLIALWLIRFTHPEPLLMLFSGEFRSTMRAHDNVIRSEIARVAGMPGAMACVYQTVCYRAGKPFVFDSTYAIATGRLTESQVDKGLAVPGIVMVAIDPRADARNWR